MNKPRTRHAQKLPEEVFGELVGILYHSPQSVLCVLICAVFSAFYVATYMDHWAGWAAAGLACGACAFRGWCLFAYPYRGRTPPKYNEAKKWALRYGAGTAAQNLVMTSVIILAFGHSPSLAAAPYGWAMATAIGSLSRTAGVLWIPVLGAITLLAPIGVAALLQPSLDAKLCGAFALINMYAAIECAKYLHSSFVGRLIAERNASHQASHDPLTGLHNRRVLDARLTEACANSGPVSLLALDLDGFKPINDTLGHAAGDEVLCQVAARLRAIVGDKGFAARTGGDEFFVLVHEPTQASGMASAIVTALSEPYELQEHTARIGVSIGLAQGMDTKVAQLIREADEALYRAKRLGRGRYEMSTAA